MSDSDISAIIMNEVENVKKMIYIVRDKNGIHARPAGVIVQTAKTFVSDVTISRGEKSADCKKLFQIMQLGVKAGDEVEIRAEGADEENAVEELGKVMREAGL